MLNKKNIPLYIALAVPIVMIIIVAAFIYLPGIGKKPRYNFLYVSGDYASYNYPGSYNVVNGRIAKIPTTNTNGTPYPVQMAVTPQLYVYNVTTNVSREISYDAAVGYTLDPATQSPDGYTVQQGSGGGGDFLFGGGVSDYNDWFLKGHNRSLKLNLKTTGSPSYYNVQFLGWIE